MTCEIALNKLCIENIAEGTENTCSLLLNFSLPTRTCSSGPGPTWPLPLALRSLRAAIRTSFITPVYVTWTFVLVQHILPAHGIITHSYDGLLLTWTYVLRYCHLIGVNDASFISFILGWFTFNCSIKSNIFLIRLRISWRNTECINIRNW